MKGIKLDRVAAFLYQIAGRRFFWLPPMESQIKFVDRQTLTPQPKANPGRIEVSSKDLGWTGIHIEKGENDSFNPDDVTVTQHYFAMNVGPAFEWEWKDGNRFYTHRYETGELWVNPAGVPFSHRINTYNQFVLLTLDPERVVEALRDRPRIDLLTFRRQHKAQDKHLQALIQALLVEAESGGPNGKLYAETLSVALATHFVNHYGTEEAPELSTRGAIARQQFQPVIDYIEASLAEEIGLDELAAIAGLSKYHFSRTFKQTFGLTPHRYLMQRRVQRATDALKTSPSGIARVAHQFGFADQSHFTRVFKQVQGLTPKQFLKQL